MFNGINMSCKLLPSICEKNNNKKKGYPSNYIVQRVWMQQHLRWHLQAAIA